MRRFWAHTIIAFTCVVGVFAAFPSIIRNLNTNGDYKTRRQFTLQLSEKEQEVKSDIIHLEDNSAEEMSKIVEKRLIQSGITSYEITSEGKDIINVAFTAENATRYTQITTYLGFSGSFALMNRDPDSEPIPASEFLNGTTSIISDLNQYPTVVIPVNTETEAYKSLIEWARKDENQVESEADEDGNTTKSAPIYIIYNYVKGDSYKTLTDNNQFNSKILITLDALSDDSLYYNENHNSFAQVCGYSDANGNGVADASEVSAAYDQANFLNNLFNAEELKYDVEVIKGLTEDTMMWTSAKVESVLSYGSIAWTGTLTALVASIVVITLILIVIYRLGAVSIATSTLVATFLTILFSVLTGMEYGVLTVVALAIVAVLGLTSGVIYFSKLKDEAYKGRTLKKANSEASRKSLLPIIDVHVIAAVVGIMLYVLGGTSVHAFASLLILGALASVIINTLGLRGLGWLVTNTTAFTGRYDLFAIDSDKVPNHMADEKQTYFGPYQDRDLTKNKKPIGIAAIALFVVSFIGVGLMGGLNGGNIFKDAKSSTVGSEVYLVDTVKVLSDEESKMTKEVVDTLFSNIKLYNNEGETVTFDEGDTHKTLRDYVSNIDSFTTTDSRTYEGTVHNYTNYYYVGKLSENLNGDKLLAKVKDYPSSDTMTLNRALELLPEIYDNYFTTANFDEFDDEYAKDSASLKAISTYSNAQVTRWEQIALATFIAVLISTLYLVLRYRLSRGLAALLFPVVTATITLGFFLLLGLLFGLALPAEVAILIPFTALITFFFEVIVSNKERDLVLDDKVRDNSYDHRKELSIKSLSMAYTYILYLSCAVVFLPLVFFGFGPNVFGYIHLGLLLGLALSILITSVLYIPVSNFLFKQFAKIDLSGMKPRKNKKKKTNVKNKSDGPQEAIFIGIND